MAAKTPKTPKTPPPGWEQEAWAQLSKAQQLHYKKLHKQSAQSAMDESKGNSDDNGGSDLDLPLGEDGQPLQEPKHKHTRLSDSQVRHGKDKAAPAPVGPDGKPLTGVKLKVWEKKQEKLQRQQQELAEVR